MGKGHTGTKGRKKSSIPKRLHPSGLIQPLHMIQTNYRPSHVQEAVTADTDTQKKT